MGGVIEWTEQVWNLLCLHSDRILEIVGLIIGLAYLYWEFRADWKVWVAGLIMPAISLFVYWNAGLYADFGIDIYYLLAALYGFWCWRWGSGQKSHTLPITHTPRPMWLCLSVVFVLIYAGIVYVLIHFTDSTVPYWDALNTSLSIIGMWMLARKWVEQWLVWLMVDAISTGLYIYKEIYFYAVLYFIYTIIAWFGYREWKRKMKRTLVLRKGRLS